MVSVIIISYNTKGLTRKCLDQLSKSTGVELEIIVVDNGSTDGSAAEIEAAYPQVKVIRNKGNVGFGKANNQGMKMAKGEYFLLLNSDCFVEKTTVADLIKAMLAMPETGVAGCKLKNHDGSLQPSYGFFPTLFRIIMLMLFIDNLPGVRRFFPSLHVRDPQRYTRVAKVDWVMGALMMIKREVYEKTGGFDENYFMYGEEVEWQYRIGQAGYQVKFIPQTSATHIGGASSPDKAPALLGEMDGWKYWFAKYFPGWKEQALKFSVILGCQLRIWLKPKYANFYREGIKKMK